jgi:Arc/MetJ-type ribon-helix-helix transcriptional regulator
MIEEEITLKIPKSIVNQIDELVREGYFSSRDEFIRYAVRESLTEIAISKKISIEECRKIWKDYKTRKKDIKIDEKEIDELLNEVDKEWKKWRKLR